jgi:chemotaxis protein methyltransferase WspC
MADFLPPILDLLRSAIGLDPDSIGRPLLGRMVEERVQASGCASGWEYLARMQDQPGELTALVELVVVPETWFFRDMDGLSLLRRRAREATERRPFRVLSAPCATGEEPYSLAMALLRAGLAPEDIRILAVDISAEALKRARQAVYGQASFRGSLPPDYQDFFQAQAQGLEPVPRVREATVFRQANLVQEEFWEGQSELEAIFCRNFLIYLDQEHKAALLARMARALRPGGLLFVGSAEAMPLLLEQFKPVGRTGSCAYSPLAAPRRAARPEALPGLPSAAQPPRPARPLRPDRAPRATEDRPAPPAPASPTTAPAAIPPLPPDLLGEVRAWADQGRLEEAVARCAALLDRYAPSPDLFALLGEARQALGQEGPAEECFRKALYLDPGHEQALAHLTLLAEARRDAAGAQRFRRRLARTRQEQNRQERT